MIPDSFEETPKSLLFFIDDVFYEYGGCDSNNPTRMETLIKDVIEYEERKMLNFSEEEKKSEYTKVIDKILKELKRYKEIEPRQYKQLIDETVISIRESLIVLKNKS